MSQLDPSLSLSRQMLQQVEANKYEDAACTLAQIGAGAHIPSVCNAEMIAALQQARALVLIQRVSLIRQLRALDTRSLYRAAPDDVPSTWRLDG